MRKTPVLLRRGPLSGGINALLRYTHKKLPNGREVIHVHDKWDVTADFDALVMEILFGDGEHDGKPCPDIVYLLDKVATGEPLVKESEREQMDAFYKRFEKLVGRHNEKGHGSK